MLLTREARGEAAYAAYVAAYEQRRSDSVANLTCFCVCGCINAVKQLSAVVGGPVICADCRKAGRRKHFLTHRPQETFDWSPYEDAPAKRPVVTTTPARRSEAEAYVRKAGKHGFKVLSRLRERVVAGQALTPTEAEQALRSKAADVKSAGVAQRLIGRIEKRLKRQLDLNAIFIGDAVGQGQYAVKDDTGGLVRIGIERPSQGVYRGFVIVTLTYGEATVKQGLQFPQPSRTDVRAYWQTYRGPSAHLVARLVANPDAARTLYQQAVAEEAA